MTKRIRNTPAIRQKFDNLRRIIADLRKGNINSRSVAALLGLNIATANDYIRMLHAEHVIEVAFVKDMAPNYRLTKFPIMLDAFLDRINMPAPEVKPLRDRTGKPGRPVTRAPGRYTNTMADDEPFRPHRASLAIPARDPLVAALFGPAGAAREAI